MTVPNVSHVFSTNSLVSEYWTQTVEKGIGLTKRRVFLLPNWHVKNPAFLKTYNHKQIYLPNAARSLVAAVVMAVSNSPF